MALKFILPASVQLSTDAPSTDLYENLQPTLEPSAKRDGSFDTVVEVEDDCISCIEFEDGSKWYGPALELPVYLSENPDLPDFLRGGSGDVYTLPDGIQVSNEQRGVVEFVKAKVLKFFKRKRTQTIVDPIVRVLAERFDSKLQPEPGLYRVNNDLSRGVKVGKISISDEPILVFLHGTATTYDGSFGGLIEENTDLRAEISRVYADRIYALEHKTISETPLENALVLAKALPAGAKVHFISQSRGGLIGELFALYSPGNSVSSGFANEHLKALKKVYNGDVVNDLHRELKKKEIVIEKFIRSACPASGTRLCSERLDKFFSTLLNILSYAAPGASGVIEIVEQLIEAILATKENPEVLPGLEVMSPDSEFVKVINSPNLATATPLHVIQGHSRVGFRLKALVTILARTVFRRANDWIVDTAAMDEGVRRVNNIGVFFHKSPDIHHFRYFKTKETLEAMLAALKATGNAVPAPFTARAMKQVTDPSDRGLFAGAYTRPFPNLADLKRSSKRGVVVVLPGILGSHLSVGSGDNAKRVFLSVGSIMLGEMADRLPIDAENVVASGVLGLAYTRLCERLSDEYDVLDFPYDWRLSIPQESERLAKRLAEIAGATDKPIRFIAHSMGGLVLRHLAKVNQGLWDQLKGRAGFRAVFAGSPLGGSYLIAEIFSGEGKRIKQLASLDLFNRKKELLEVFAEYPGLAQLCPWKKAAHDFTKVDTWDKLKAHSKDFVVPKNVLDEFAMYLQEVRAIEESGFYNDPNIIYVAGKAKSTLDGYFFTLFARKGEELRFTSTPDGDGSVPWASGIPDELIQRGNVYYINEGHGVLCDSVRHFDGYLDLLQSGTTRHKLFYKNPSELPSGFFARYRGEAEAGSSDHQWVWNLLGAEDDSADDYSVSKVKPFGLKVTCGDMNYAAHPVLLGHLDEDVIMGAESVMDRLLNGELSTRLRMGNYVYSNGETLLLKYKDKLKTIIVGLGKPNTINSLTIAQAVTKALLEYAMQEKAKVDEAFELELGVSTVLLGSDYIGLNVQQSLDALFKGVTNANQALATQGIGVRFTHLEVVEHAEGKACDIFLAAKQKSLAGELDFTIAQTDLIYVEGYRRTLPTASNTAWWMRLYATKTDERVQASTDKTISVDFAFSEGLARVKAEQMRISNDALEPIFRRLSVENRWSEPAANAMYNLLIPYGFRGVFEQHQNLHLTLDRHTARYPWELMRQPNVNAEPFSVRGGMMRKLILPINRERINRVKSDSVLVVGDPNLEGWNRFGQLAGANAEGKAVADAFNGRFEVTAHIGDNAFDINLSLHSRGYRVIHLAAHGVHDDNDPDRTGLIIGRDRYIRPADLQNLNEVPELVFVNACYLGSLAAPDNESIVDRYKLSAGFAESLIGIGVRAVVVAAWAVDDPAALDFAKRFYHEMFNGASFSEAILEARRTVFESSPNTNTWGAYQAYGDENYTLTSKQRSKAKKDSSSRIELQAMLRTELYNLLNTKRTEAQERKVLERLRAIELHIKTIDKVDPEIVELLALNFEQLREYDAALYHFEKARLHKDGRLSVRSLELELKVRRKKIMASENSKKVKTQLLKEVVDNMDLLLKVGETSERLSLQAANYKNLVQVACSGSRPAIVEALNSIESSIKHYQMSESAATDAKDKMYPLCNRLTLEFIKVVVSEQSMEQKQIADHLEVLDRSYLACGGTQLLYSGYWDRLIHANYQLVRFLYTPEKAVLSNYIESILDAWKNESSVDKVRIEIEHLEFLITTLNNRSGLCEQLMSAKVRFDEVLNRMKA
jgi:hypothetical protein